MSDAPWAPTHILGEDLYQMRKARGDNHYYPPSLAPGRCIVCGAPHTTCVDNSGTFAPIPVSMDTTILPILEDEEN